MSSGCSEHIESIDIHSQDITSRDIRREKRLLRSAIAISQGPHRIRLQRELAALEEYERAIRRRSVELATLT